MEKRILTMNQLDKIWFLVAALFALLVLTIGIWQWQVRALPIENLRLTRMLDAHTATEQTIDRAVTATVRDQWSRRCEEGPATNPKTKGGAT